MIQTGLNPNDSGQDFQPLQENEQKALEALEQDLYGQIHADAMPRDLSQEMLRARTRITPTEWKSLSAKERGKIEAAAIIKNQLQLVERYHAAIKRNVTKARQERESAKKRANSQVNRNQKPKRTKKSSRYRRR